MALTKQKKVEIVKDLEGIVKGAKTIVFVNFKGLPVAEVTDLRRKLREQGVGYKVAKKNLIIRALGSIDISGELPNIPGQVAISYGTDMLAPAREVFNFQKDHKEMLSIAGGVFEGKYLGSEEMISIATIPSMDVLYSKLLYLIKSPLQRLTIAMSEIAKKKE